MEIRELAEKVLWSPSLDDKLVGLLSPLTDGSPGRPVESPPFPSRSSELNAKGRTAFPSLEELKKDEGRARMLHFFANHELLAMEIMALVLLKFPWAPKSFRKDIAVTLIEEQKHLGLYRSRMRELGLDFGELPVNDFFWSCLRNVSSPLDYVTQMSLTFEQANLDFSLHYANCMEKIGDKQTHSILIQVYEDEIRHVRKGLQWFREWCKNSYPMENEFQAYSRRLPRPLTPSRAKGSPFSELARKKSGFSDDYIRELEMYSGSKGRPPVIWKYNPSVEFEISQKTEGYQPSKTAAQLVHDLESLLMFLAKSSDIVLVHKAPSVGWLRSLQALKEAWPRFLVQRSEESIPDLDAEKIGGTEPWGWSPNSFALFKKLSSKLVAQSDGNSAWASKLLEKKSYADSQLAPFYSKVWSAEYLRRELSQSNTPEAFIDREQVGMSHKTWEEVDARLKKSLPLVIKAPYGTSGAQIRRVYALGEVNESLMNWVKRTQKVEGSVVVEPLLDKVCDLSLQFHVHSDRVEVLGIRQTHVDSLWRYRATRFGTHTTFSPEIHRFLSEKKVFSHWEAFARKLGETLRAGGYQGPAGLDGLLAIDNGKLVLKPIVELNNRWTMGRVALALESFVPPHIPAVWFIVLRRHWEKWGFENALSFALSLRRDQAVTLEKQANHSVITSGAFVTSEPGLDNEALSVLVVGNEMLSKPYWMELTE